MKADEIVQAVQGKDDDFVLHTQEELDQLIENTKRAYDEEVVPAKLTEIQNKFDEDVFKITGERRTAPERTHDFVKRTLAQYYEKAQGVTELEREKAELLKKIEEGSNDEQLKADRDRLKADYLKLQEESEGKIKEVTSKFEKYKVESDIRSPLSGFTFNERFPESVIKSMSESAIKKLSGMARIQDDVMVFVNEKGEVLRNKNNQLNPYTAGELLKEELKDIIKTEKGTGPSISDEIHKEFTEDGKLKKILIMLPNEVNTKVKLGEYLVSKGLLRGTKEYDLAYVEYGKDLPLR